MINCPQRRIPEILLPPEVHSFVMKSAYFYSSTVSYTAECCCARSLSHRQVPSAVFSVFHSMPLSFHYFPKCPSTFIIFPPRITMPLAQPLVQQMKFSTFWKKKWSSLLSIHCTTNSSSPSLVPRSQELPSKKWWIYKNNMILLSISWCIHCGIQAL